MILLVFYNSALFSNEEINIAIIDTGFCDNNKSLNNIKIIKSYDATKTIENLSCDLDFENKPRFHGQLVLNTFLKYISTKNKINIFPIIVYDNRGESKLAYWQDAITNIKKQKIDLVISSVGLKILKDEKIELTSGIWIVAAPRVSPFIKKDDLIFPQYLSNNKTIFLLGEINNNKQIDTNQLYIEKMYLFLESDHKHIGSSFIVPKYVASIINKHSKRTLRVEKLTNTYELKEVFKN